MKDTLQQYMEVREALRREKDQLEQRLREINIVLGDGSTVAGSPKASAPRGRGRRGGGQGGQSLRQMVLEMTAQRPMSKQEILDEVQRRGYKFESKNPANSLGVILYGKNPRFTNQGGRFSHSGSVPAGGGRKQMTSEARARIRAAALARWKKAKSEGRSRL